MTALPVAVDLRHGPRCQPVRIGHGLARVPIGGPLPFLGIASAGLVERARQGDGRVSWMRIAPVLEDVLDQLARSGPDHRPARKRLIAGALAALGDDPATDREAELVFAEAMVEAALARDVLTYAQSARAAASFVERLVDGEVAGWPSLVAERGLDPCVRPARCQLWSVREGHTSSIWRVTLEARGWPHPLVFGLNVARDGEAAGELLDTAAAQVELHRRDPDGIIPVLATAEVQIATGRGMAAVPVVLVPWLEDARELHVVPGPEGPHGAARFFVVERFEAPEAGGPVSGQRAVGEILDEERSDWLWEQHLARCVRMLAFECAGIRVPAFELNDGDLVLWRGSSVAVGLGRPPPPRPPGPALLELLLLSAHPNGLAAPRDRLYWNRPARAVEVLERGWAERGHDPALLDVALAGARAASADEPREPGSARAEALRRLELVLGRW